MGCSSRPSSRMSGKRDGIEIGVVSGLSSGYSYARTMLAVKRIPVAVVIDADSPEQEVASERQTRRRRGPRRCRRWRTVSGHRRRTRTGDLVLQEDAIAQEGLREEGYRVGHRTRQGEPSPSSAEAQILTSSYEHLRFKILRAMDEADIKALRATGLIEDLLSFLGEALAYSKRPAVSRV